jgi:3-oxoadipate enol-lactonase
MPHATRDGCRIYYELAGDPVLPVIVLIRGLGRSSRYWGPFLPHLPPTLRVLLLDNRGVGRSDTPRTQYTTRVLADDVAAVMDAARVSRAHVFGMSLGGMIAQELALAHPDRIDHLILGCTTPGGARAHATPARTRLVMLLGALGFDGPMHRLLVADPDPAIREQWRALARTDVRLRGVARQARAAIRHDAHDRLGAITHPTLVLTGDTDAIIPHANSSLLAAAIPNARLAILPGARHDFTTDRGADAARVIVEFLGA